jgi:hypothetical protein
MPTIGTNGALVQQRRLRDLVAGEARPARGVIVGAAAVGEPDLQPKLVPFAWVRAVVAGPAGVAADGQVEVEPGGVDEQPVDQDRVGVGAGHQ